jgi:hypothetical protein
MAADRMHVHAICNLAIEAIQGFFDSGHFIQEDNRREPDLEEGFRLFLEGARLGHAYCCARLGECYLDGSGTEVNPAKVSNGRKKQQKRVMYRVCFNVKIAIISAQVSSSVTSKPYTGMRNIWN